MKSLAALCKPRRLARPVLWLMLAMWPALAVLAETPPRLEAPGPRIFRVTIHGPITPATMGSLHNAIERANSEKAAAVLVSLDTPGGLMSSMDEMIRDILGSRVPVITYVSPPGATCGSAGVFLLMASHVAAMAPATNLGSATPVQMGGPPGRGDDEEKGMRPGPDRIPEEAGADDALNLKRKLMHHAVAQIRGLAEFHGRNAAFAERTVTRADNITSSEALAIHAIDVLALTEAELLTRLEGRSVRMSHGTVQLALRGATVVDLKEDFRDRILRLLSDPNLAYILMMIGVVGILAEVQYPGSIFPGVIGAICLILGLYAMQTLPVNWAGLGLVLLGFVFFILEIKIVSYGMLSVAGAVSLLLGTIMMARSGDEVETASLVTILTTTAVALGFSLFLAYKSASAMRSEPVSGDPRLLRETGRVVQAVTDTTGRIFIHGEYWNARSVGPEPIPVGTPVHPVRRDGMTLYVTVAAREPLDGAAFP